jgi:hypothetical protein
MLTAILIEDRSRIALVASILALSTAMAIWADLFLFAKSVVEREWVNRLPESMQMMAGSIVVLACLIPTAFVIESPRAAVWATAKAILLSPLAAVAVCAWASRRALAEEWYLAPLGLFSQYIWILLFHCIAPALVLLAIRITFHRLYEHLSG